MKDSNYEHRPLVAMSTTGRISVYPTQGPPTVRLHPKIKADVPPAELPNSEIEVPRRPRIVKLNTAPETSSQPVSPMRKAFTGSLSALKSLIRAR